MSISLKVLIIVLATSLILTGVIFGASKIMFTRSFQALGNESAQQNIQRAIKALSASLKSLNTLNSDWSARDDCYDFVKMPNNEFLNANTTDAAFANIKLNILLIVNESGTIIFSKGYDLNNNRVMAIPQNTIDQLTNHTLISC